MAIFVIVGLMGASPTAPAMAEVMRASTMADGMPCCPPHRSMPADCCQKCPIGIVCVSMCIQGALVSAIVPFLPSYKLVIARYGDLLREGLGHSPPSRPPRFLV
jgi:hypothetical protein